MVSRMNIETRHGTEGVKNFEFDHVSFQFTSSKTAISHNETFSAF
ncbi:hypothetical protein E2C01_001777 [Portunus trituberculatus]|uniref:Uncharacterized protein n=1 Tax=Portunus trituberculatus TaxID=210409 RepID=A0A5B7CIT6_PORTR|nr:hypothetical protein [Portunus trituberculatus]